MKRIANRMVVLLMALLAMALEGTWMTASALESHAAAPALAISIREIDLGVIGPGEHARGQFQISNSGQGVIQWSMEEPADWESLTGRSPAGESGAAPSRVDVLLSSLRERTGSGEHPVELQIVSGRNTWVLRRNLAEGPYREALRIESNAGSRTVFVKFILADARSRPALEVEPRGIDLGDTDPVREVTRRIRITNSGAGVLKWQAATRTSSTARATQEAGRGKYISLLNEGLTTGAPYAAPAHFKETLQISGNWIAEKGYPKGAGAGYTLRFQFQGAGVILYGRKLTENSLITVSIDDRPTRETVPQALEGDRFEFDLDESLVEGPHMLQVHLGDGTVILEGFFVADPRAAVPPSAWLRLTPLSGTTTRETDFVTLRMNLSEFKPGIYTDYIVVTSNGGTARIPVSLNVTGEQLPKVLSVYRYTRGSDLLLTSQPDKEDPRYLGAYQRAGLAFRLFSPGTAGTVELYRWYNPSIGDHYYATERSGGRKNLVGYLFEGPIGNIATIRLPATRELYRWFNPATGHYFFTNDAGGEGVGRKGYQFEGIVGFVMR
jgi:hypothetical protein